MKRTKLYKVFLSVIHGKLHFNPCYMNVEALTQREAKQIASELGTIQIQELRDNKFYSCTGIQAKEITKLNYPINQIYF